MTDQQTPPPVVLWAAGSATGPATLGRVLVAYRAATGLTQLELGDLLGFTQPYLSRLERGDRTIGDVATLQRIAARLGIPAHCWR
jgi:transcriptional regulator with XRE-family HTH domain